MVKSIRKFATLAHEKKTPQTKSDYLEKEVSLMLKSILLAMAGK